MLLLSQLSLMIRKKRLNVTIMDKKMHPGNTVLLSPANGLCSFIGITSVPSWCVIEPFKDQASHISNINSYNLPQLLNSSHGESSAEIKIRGFHANGE